MPTSTLQSALLQTAGFRHAFFTRHGGVSTGPFASLNFSISVGDADDSVQTNLGIAARTLGVEPGRVLFVDQVHGVTVHTVSGALSTDQTVALQGDAVASRDPSVACAVRIADCAPVLLADAASGAVVAVHSGWRSTQQNIVGHALRALSALSHGPTRVLATVGPHIEACCFEVGDDVAEALSKCSPATDVIVAGKRERPHVDLRRVIEAQLIDGGVEAANIEHVRGCTVCNGSFFSYRRDGKQSGRMLAAIVARG